MSRKKPTPPTPPPDKPPPGPKPDTLKIEGMGWEAAAKKSLTKKKPAGGWPKPGDEGK